MRKIIIFTLLLVISHMGFSQDRYRVTSKSVLNVRSAASTNAPILGTFNNGTIINVYSNDGSWARTIYKGKTAYVSSQYITLVMTAAQVEAGKQAAINANKTPWYSPMSWGVIGWLIRWIAIPFCVLGIGVILPFLFIAEIREINNFFLGCISYVGGFFVLKLFIAILQSFDVYNGGGESIVLWVLGIIMTFGGIKAMLNSRCPNCHYNESSIISSYVTRRTRTTTTKYSDGSRDVSSTSTDTTNNHRQCPECGYDWWTQE